MQASTRFTVLAALIFSGCSSPAPSGSPTAQAVRVAEVRVGPIVEGREHLATVVPAQSVRVLAQVPGSISSLGAPAGQPLQQGELVARIAAPDVVARGARVSAERRRAQRERDFVCEQLDTDRQLAASGDLPGVQLDRSEKACASASLAVDSATAAEREARVAGTRAKETAPFDGQVLDYLVDEGQTVMPGTPVALYGSEAQQLQVRVVASDLSEIAVGTEVETPAGPGQVVEIGAVAQGPGRLFEVRIAIDPDTPLYIGQTLTAVLVVDSRADATAVPASAIAQDEEGVDYVLVEQSGRIDRVGIEPGPQQQGWVAIEPALPAGTRVVTGAVAQIDPNRPVMAVLP